MGAPSQTWVQKAFEVHAPYIEDGFVDLEPDEFRRCWCCGNERRKLQKCHIIPKALGGSNKPENIIPLCAMCHDKAPDVADKDHMFQWIKDQQNPLTGVGMGDRYEIFQTTNDLFKKRNLDYDKHGAAYMEWLYYYLEKISNHGGQHGQGVYVKNSSYIWAIEKALSKLIKFAT